MIYTCDNCKEDTPYPRYTRVLGESKLIFCSPSCYIYWVLNTKDIAEETNGSNPSE